MLMLRRKATSLKEKDRLERQRLYDRTRDDLLKRQLSNSENADRAVLTVSVFALGFALAYRGQVDELQALSWLYFSWVSFVAAILCTLWSFFTSQSGIDVQLELAQRYFYEYDEDAFSSKSLSAIVTNWLNRTAAFIFSVGILSLSFTVYLNQGKDPKMAIRGFAQDGALVPTLQKVSSDVNTRGATIPSMQPAKPQGGAPVPAMQKPATPPPAPSKTDGK